MQCSECVCLYKSQVALHGDARRVIILGFIDQSPRLIPHQYDPRVLGVVPSLRQTSLSPFPAVIVNRFPCVDHRALVPALSL